MAKQGQVTKIYELKTLGYSELSKQLDNVASKFDAIKKAKASAQSNLVTSADTADIRKYADEVEKLTIKEQQLRIEKLQLTNAMKAETIQRQQGINQQKQQTASNNAEAGSISLIRQQIKELNASLILKNQNGGGLINFKNEILSIDQATAKLKILMAEDQAYRRQFTKDNTLVGEYTSGIVQAFKQMGLGDIVGGQITKAKTSLQGLDAEMEKLKGEFDSAKAKGVTDFTAIEAKMIANRKEAAALGSQVAALQTHFRGTGDIGNQITTSIANGFKNMRNQLGQFVLGYIGFQAVISGAGKLFHENLDLSDSFAQLRIYLHGTSDDAQVLFEQLKKIDTRTSLSGLVDIATVIAKKGVAKQEIAGVTQALDQLFVVLGKEIGDPHEAVASLVKLVNVYSEDKHVSAKNIQDIGAAIQKLTSSGVATGSFLINFAERLAGIRGITGVSITNVLGLGAAIQELGQRSEVAGTAASQLIIKMFTDIPKYAGFAGKSVEEFTKMIGSNPVEALITLAEGLKKNKAGLGEVAEAFTAAGVHGARVLGVLGDIAGNADYMRKRVADSNKAFGDQGTILAANEIKQRTFAATWDRILKQFETIGTSRGVQVTLAGIATALAFVLANLVPIIAALGLYAIGWLAVTKEIIVNGIATQVTNGQLVLQRLLLIGNNIVLAVTRVYLGAITLAQIGYNLVLAVFTRNAGLARTAMQAFSAAIKANPIGIFLTILAVVAGAVVAFANGLTRSTAALKAQALQLQINNEIADKANEKISDQIAKIDSWKKVIESAAASADTKLIAMQKLIEIDSRFSEALSGQTILLGKLKEAYDSVTESIKLQAQAEASSQLSAEKQAQVLKITTTRQRLESEVGRGKSSIDGFTNAEIDVLKNLPSAVRTGGGAKSGGLEIKDGNEVLKLRPAKEVLAALKVAENDAISVYQAYLGTQANIQSKLEEITKKGKEHATKNQRDQAETDKLSVSELTALIKGIDEEYDMLKEGDPKLKQLSDLRDSYQKRLDALNNKNVKGAAYKGSRLTGEQKDAFKDIDAARDEDLAKEKLNFEKKLSTEEQYLNSVLTINEIAIDKKLSLLKGKNAEERKQIADLQLLRITEEKQTNDAIYALRAKALKDNFDILEKNAQEEARRVAEDPNTSATARAQATLDSDKKILQGQIIFNAAMDKLEKDRNLISKKNQEDRDRAARDEQAKLNQDILKLTLAQIDDQRTTGEKLVAEFKIIMNQQRQAVIDSKKSQEQKDRGLKEIDRQDQIGTLARELAALKVSLPLYKKALEEKSITEQQYNVKFEEYVKKQLELSKLLNDGQLVPNTSVKNLLTNKLADAFGFDKNSEEAKLFAQTVQQTFDLAKTAMDDYYQREKDNIERSKNNQLQRLQLETDQRIARAQSKDEEISIQKQAAAKQEQINREAFEKNKKLQREQAKINLAIQLSNLAVIAFAPNPANIATLGVAGAIMYAIQAAIAIAGYALNVSRINSAQYAFGGKPGEVPTGGGQFGGRPHSEGGTDFSYKGEQYNAEVGELAVIRTKNAPSSKKYTVSGTQMEIASAINKIGGGISFKPGASVRKFESGGYLGDALQPPVFASSSSTFVSLGLSEAKMDELITTMNSHAKEQSKRIDRIQVQVSEQEISKAQSKQVKRSSIGTL